MLLIGAALVAFSGTKPWAQGSIAAVWGRLAGLQLNGALGFDHALAPGPEEGDVRPAIFAAAAVLAVAALLLFITRVRGVGLLWRLLALAATAVPAWIAVVAWEVVENPASLVTDGDGAGRGIEFTVQAAAVLGVAQASPGVGLWLLTAGSALAVIAVLIPASRSVEPMHRSFEPATAGGSPAGWYPAPDGQGRLRFFDGYAWTPHIRERPLDSRDS